MKKRRTSPTTLAIVLTVAYLGLALFLFNGSTSQFKELDLNEIGDFLAGFIGPLALLWLIAGFFQQGQEIRLQVEELRKSVDQHKQLVEISQEELEMLRASIDREKHFREYGEAPNWSFLFIFDRPDLKLGKIDIRNRGAAQRKVTVKLSCNDELFFEGDYNRIAEMSSNSINFSYDAAFDDLGKTNQWQVVAVSEDVHGNEYTYGRRCATYTDVGGVPDQLHF